MSFAIVFPGQGSQKVGMLNSLLEAYPPTHQLLDEASTIVGYDIATMITYDAEGKLDQTTYTQPALLTTEYALWQCWRAHHTDLPQYLAGHSLGEYTALVCAGALAFKDALLLVKLRGELMQQVVMEGAGAMAAIIGLENAAVERACHQVSQKDAQVACANYNCPQQVVISGHTAAVEAAMALTAKMGAKLTKRLAVSVPSHSPLMLPAAEALAIALEGMSLTSPEIPIIHNVDVAIHPEPTAIKQALMHQLYSPVRWVDTIQALALAGVDHLIECGPGNILSGLTRRINPSLKTESFSHYTDCVRGVTNYV